VASGGVFNLTSGALTVSSKGSLTVASGGQFSAIGNINLYGPMTNAGTINLGDDYIYLYNDGTSANKGGVVNAVGGIINLHNNEDIETSTGPEDYFINQGALTKTGGALSLIEVSSFANAGAINSQKGTLAFTHMTLASSSVLKVGLNSASDYGAILWQGATSLTLAGAFNVNLNNGYVPANGVAFPVLTATGTGSSLVGAFSSITAPASPIWMVTSSSSALQLATVSTITWATPANITYGTPLGAGQLDAVAGVPGRYVYSPPTGTVLPAGPGQTLSVTFTPTDTAYLPATVQVALNVLPATLTITANSSSKVYGQTVTFMGNEFAATGLQNGDTAVTATLTSAGAGPSAGVGDYSIVPSGLTGGTFSPGNYTINYVNGTLTVTPAPVTIVSGVTAQNKVYDRTATATLGFNSVVLAGVVNNDPVSVATGGYTATFPSVNVGNSLVVTVSGLGLTGTPAANYTLTQPTGLEANITPRPITVTAGSNTKTYNGTTSAAATPTITAGALLAGDTASWSETYDTRNAGSGKTLMPTGTVSDGNGGNNYTVIFVPVTTGTINKLAITVTAVTNTKTYDGTTNAANLPTITTGALITPDTASWTETYNTRNAGTGLTLTPSGTVSDGNNGNNYKVTFNPVAAGTINKLTITVTAVTSTKVYDGTTSSPNTPSITGTLGTGDTPAFIETYGNRNVGNGKKLTPSGTVNDGNGGNNYTVTFNSVTTGSVTVLPIAVTAAPNSKTYDGTTTATATPTLSAPLGKGDTGTFTETYDTRNAGSGKTLTPSGSVSDGNNGLNYNLSFPTATTGTILPLAITVTAAPNTKTYDGTTSAASKPTITTGALITPDTASWSETYDTRNAGSNKTLTPTGTVSDGNGGNNYTVTPVRVSTGTILPLAITVTAAANTKTYDGTTNAATLPAITTGALITPDTASWTETYNTRNAGVGETLTPSGTVSDGNGGNNYNVTFVPVTTGTINKLAITVTSVTGTKVYDGTTSSTNTPTISPALAPGDTAAFVENYGSRNVGTGKNLISSGTVNDGNSGNNYTVTFAKVTTGAVTVLPITVTAAPNSKTYDGTTTATATPTLSAPLGTGDTGTFTETYDTRNAGSGKTLTPRGSVSDGNNGANYNLSFPTATTGTILPLAITVTAAANSKTYDGTTSAASKPAITTGALITPDTASWSEAYDTRNAGSNKTLTPTGTVSDGNGGNNYTVTPVRVSTGTILPLAITVTAAANTKTYDGTTSAASKPTITTGALITPDTASWSETYDTKNVGSNKMLTPAGTVTDGNGGNNYNVTFCRDSVRMSPFELDENVPFWRQLEYEQRH